MTKKNARETTDVFVVSDHGFSTIERSIDFETALAGAGFDAIGFLGEKPKAGQVMIVGNGGTILFYVVEHDHAVVARLAEWLQHSDFAGVIFAREKIDGTFPLETVHLNIPEAPDIVLALRWNAVPNRFGAPGEIVTDSVRKAGNGSHASLSEFDVHNTLIAAGPDFRRGAVDDLPSGNVDLAPTILHLLGLVSPARFDGRVLFEAMSQASSLSLRATTETIEAARHLPAGEWRQHLRVSHFGDATYIDEGNGAFEAR